MTTSKDDKHEGRDERNEGRTAGAAQPDARERKVRKVGPVDVPVSDEDIAAQRELVDETLAAGGSIVASDGERELVQFDPVDVDASSGWRPQNGRQLYTPKLLLKAGDVGTPVMVGGFGLLDGEGTQVAWSALPEPVAIPPNTTAGFESAISF